MCTILGVNSDEFTDIIICAMEFTFSADSLLLRFS